MFWISRWVVLDAQRNIVDHLNILVYELSKVNKHEHTTARDRRFRIDFDMFLMKNRLIWQRDQNHTSSSMYVFNIIYACVLYTYQPLLASDIVIYVHADGWSIY